MVNHVRTWLANLPPLSGDAEGDEFIETSFTPIRTTALSTELRQIRTALFGANPTRDAVNVKLAVYMQILHTSALAEEMTTRDSRITYSPDGSDVFGSAISSTDREHAVLDALAGLEFLNNAGSSFFDGQTSRRSMWQQADDPLTRLAAVLMTAAEQFERAATQ